MLQLFRGEPLVGDTPAARAEVPALIGHLLYGVVTGLSLAVLRMRRIPALNLAATARGVIAGLVSASVLGLALDAQHGVPAFSMSVMDDSRATAWVGILALGAAAGALYAALYPSSPDGAGGEVIRGTALGFILWIVGALTLVPIIQGDGLDWTLNHL